jgi:hypothetical protein
VLTGYVTTILGSAGQDGDVDGTGAAARLTSGTTALTCSSHGVAYVADVTTFKLRSVTPVTPSDTFVTSRALGGSPLVYRITTEWRNTTVRLDQLTAAVGQDSVLFAPSTKQHVLWSVDATAGGWVGVHHIRIMPTTATAIATLHQPASMATATYAPSVLEAATSMPQSHCV